MHIRLPILSLLAAAGLLAAPAGAQTLAARTEAAMAGTSPEPARPAAATQALDLKRSVALRSAAPAAATTVHAAGSVLLLADGIVADARIAPLAPPAPGFVYER